MDAKEIKKRVRERPVANERPKKKNYLLLEAEIDLIDDLTVRYSRAKVNDTEVVRAAIRAFNKLPKEKGLEEIIELPKVKPGPRAKG